MQEVALASLDLLLQQTQHGAGGLVVGHRGAVELEEVQTLEVAVVGGLDGQELGVTRDGAGLNCRSPSRWEAVVDG